MEISHRNATRIRSDLSFIKESAASDSSNSSVLEFAKFGFNYPKKNVVAPISSSDLHDRCAVSFSPNV